MRKKAKSKNSRTAKGYSQAAAEDRLNWAREQPQSCMHCGAVRVPLEIHEIERRSHAAWTWAARCNYLLLCQRCHDGAYATMPHAAQLATKQRRDPDNYDLQAWLRLRDPELRAPHRVTQREVDACCC